MDAIETLLTRGVEKIYPTKEALEKVLRSGKKLRVYQGFDPTSPQLHLGHMIGLRKLRHWQDLGHEVIFLIGDFTGMIGDPSGKDKTRIPLTREQVLHNAKYYKEQAGKIIRFNGENPVIIKYNSEWLNKITVPELTRLMSFLTYQQIIERDMFQRRLKNNMDIFVNEFFYPFLQGYDSVAMDVDVEVGGNDQMFNMMTGRDLMHKMKRKDKFVMTTPLLTDASGKKIGKTENNVIMLTDKPNDLYGKIMALGDDVIVKGLEYLTDVPMTEITQIGAKMQKGENPMQFKKLFAFEVVKQLNSQNDAETAQSFFEQAHQKQTLNIQASETVEIGENVTIIDCLNQKCNLSRNEVKRLLEQKAIDMDGLTITDPTCTVKKGCLIKIGKHKYVRIK